MNKKHIPFFDFNKPENINLDIIYDQCSGPGGLKLVDFLADKMKISADSSLLDVGANRGFPTCYLTKKYQTHTVAIDPWYDLREPTVPLIQFIKENAQLWNVEKHLEALMIGLPNSYFKDCSFDYVYSTTALEMIRMLEGEEGYLTVLKDILRILKPGGIFGLAEPMHLEVDLPEDLEPYVSQVPFPWKECFRSISQTKEALKLAGFEILEADYAPHAQLWWREYAQHDPLCKSKPEEDPKTLEVDNGRWTSFGYIIARKK